MDGVLLIDKPSGLTSHDVVAWARRRLRQRDIGHAGTLDPMATGLLVVLVGGATRLSTLLTGKDKSYEAEIRLGFKTSTDDAEGEAQGESGGDLPEEARVRECLASFAGSFAQLPPAHSAKKIAGRPAYALARRQEPVTLRPVDVTLRSFDWIERDGDRVRIRLTVSAGFYVRALARDLGERLGCGGHLSALRRTASGSFTIGQALSIAVADDPAVDIGSHLVAPAAALPDIPAVRLTAFGLKRVLHGNPVGQADVAATDDVLATGKAKILADDGRLVALAEWRNAALHPVVVLG